MPHSSDSEAFESADEDVIEQRTKTAKAKAPKDARVQALTAHTKALDIAAKPTAETTQTDAVTATTENGWDDWDSDADDADANQATTTNNAELVAAPSTVSAPAAGAAKQSQVVADDADGWDEKWSDTEENNDDVVAERTTFPTASSTRTSAQTNETTSNPVGDGGSSSGVGGGGGGGSGGGGGWGIWSAWSVGQVGTLLASATDSMAAITTQVTTAIESGIGVPAPEELVRRQRDERPGAPTAPEQSGGADQERRLQTGVETDGASGDNTTTTSSSAAGGGLLFDQLVSGVTHIGSRVLTGGLGTLEGIGKKTMQVLQTDDPGLRNKRRLLRQQLDGGGVLLSQVLREAKEAAEAEEKSAGVTLQQQQQQQRRRQIQFERLFDDYNGLVHLEALEMLSRQSELKLQQLLQPLAGRALVDMQETIDEVKELCELPDDDDGGDEDAEHGGYDGDQLAAKLADAVEDLDVPMDFGEIVRCWEVNAAWLVADADGAAQDAQQVHERSLRCLAETTALAVHRLHKLAELLLVKERHSTANEADALVQLVGTLSWHLGGIAARFGRQLGAVERSEQTSDFITSTFLEGANSVSYIRNAFQLFIPILQFGAA